MTYKCVAMHYFSKLYFGYISVRACKEVAIYYAFLPDCPPNLGKLGNVCKLICCSVDIFVCVCLWHVCWNSSSVIITSDWDYFPNVNMQWWMLFLVDTISVLSLPPSLPLPASPPPLSLSLISGMCIDVYGCLSIVFQCYV